jgi:hypothetical protein
MGDLDYGTLLIIAAALLLPSAIILTIFTIIRLRRGRMPRRRIPVRPSSIKTQKPPVPVIKKRKS